jgi:hypothetical protein
MVKSAFGSDAADVMALLGHPITSFPVILAVSLVGALLGTYLTPPEEESVLKEFYRRVRPWGFWGPIEAKVLAEEPSFQKNTDFWRDMFNIAVGIVWQTCFIVLAIYLVTRSFRNVAITAGILALTCLILKKTWYDTLPPPSPEPVSETRTEPDHAGPSESRV